MRLQQFSALLAVCATATGAAAAGVVPMSITHTGRSRIPMHRRSDTYTQTLTNNISYGGYFASISIGTPSQSQEVVLDTGSSDTWFLSSDASVCSSTSGYGPVGMSRRQSLSSSCVSTFDYSSSTSFTNLSTIFDIEYVDGSAVAGYYFTDDITIGGATIDTLQMGLADQSDLTYGIMGIGFAADESAQTLYPNIIDKFYSEGLIGAKAYSLYLDDLQSSTGTILFGGIDSDKYNGDLIAVPIIKDASANNYTSFLVTLSSVAAVYSNGSMAQNYTSSAEAVVLDSGTTLTYLPEDMAQSILDTFSATYDESAGYATVDCDLVSDLSLAFQFGGAGGPTIQVSLSELILADGSTMTFGPGGEPSETSTCAFGVSMSSETYLLGDTFLRSAYVVYDLDAKEVAMAQANFNSTTTSITAITSGSSIPLVSSTATAVVASSTGTSFSGSTDSSQKSGAGMAMASLFPVALGVIAGAMLVFA